MPRSFQEWVHWLELGGGARWIRRLALFFGVALLSLWICYKQFHGPKSETTLAQAVVGRQLADGRGYTTLINYPQTAALLQQKAGRSWTTEDLPEMHSAPLYPAAIATMLKLIPSSYRGYFFDILPAPPDGFLPDYLLLGLNVVLFWIAAAQTYLLGRALFDETVGRVAAFALILSAAIWEQVVAVNGTPLMMVVFLSLMQAGVRVERISKSGEVAIFSLLLSGALCGAMFLCDYAAGFVVVAFGAYVWVRFAGERFKATAPLIAGFLLVASPWCTLMILRTGLPVGFAWQEIAMKLDGTPSDPWVVRTTLSTVAPMLDLSKLGNKGLTAIQSALGQQLWAAGGYLFTGFFVASFLYRFRESRVNTVRALFVAVLGLLILANAFLDSGTSERLPAVYATPLIIVLGVGFCAVLIASNHHLADHGRWVFAGLLAVHVIPLVKDAIEPRRLHFHYPPYYPALFLGMRDEMTRRGGANPGWMADVPAGAAWYSGQRVWAQPATLRDFYAIGAEQPMLALVLTPQTLDKPFFSDIGRRTDAADRKIGDWSQVYTALVTGRPPPGFPLTLPQKIADNLYVLIDPLAQPIRPKSR